MLADPKAIKHVLHSAGYHYPKSVERMQVNKVSLGNGIVSAQGLHAFNPFSIATHDATVQARLITVSGR